MRESQLRVKPFDILEILSYEATEMPNEHGKVSLRAAIKNDKEQEYLSLAKKTSWVEISAEDGQGNETILFYGVLQRMKIEKEGNYSVMSIELASGTVLLEDQVHLRSFQKTGLTYRDLLEVCNEDYEDAGAIMTEGKGTSIPHLILQYRENNWFFIKRICALAGGLLVPSCTVKGVKYFFGMPRKNEKACFNTDCYSIEQQEIMSYVIESREIHRIGETASFLGRDYIIWKTSTKMRGSELYHTYYLSQETKKLVKEGDQYQEHIIGASLLGEVISVDGEKVKISILDDENKENSGSRWFSFSTVYSSSDGAGWYCMPEIGDKVRLYFPSANEGEGYVSSAVHEKEGDGIRTNPENKIWRNKYGKEIRLTPDCILITNNNGNSVELSDNRGIHIKSNGSINIKAANRLQITSENSGIEFTASNRISMQQGDSEIRMQDEISLKGTKVNMM